MTDDLQDKLATEDRQKETGSYYTPRYIVDYIVDETITPLYDEYDDLDNLSVCDPACGAGVFLIGALEHISEERQRRNPNLGEFKARKRTAEHNLYGVDLLPEAAERTRENLREAVAEPTDRDTVDVDLNIKVGNSLVGSSLSEIPVDICQ